MRARALACLVVLALPLGLSACPALLSDNFRIVSDAAPSSDTDVGNSSDATTDKMSPDAASMDDRPDELKPVDGATPRDNAPPEASGGSLAVGPDVAAEGPFDGGFADGPTPDATSDAQPPTADVSVDAAAPDAPAEACTSISPTTFGCGSTGYQFPTQYCVYRSGINGNPDTTVGMATPSACQCSGAYTCSCLLASGQTLCPADTPTYIDCQTGTTGGVVVGCQPADAADATSDAVSGCTPNTRACNGKVIVICNSSGQWQEATLCPNACSSGVCI